ncbi:MAG: hypothetical protein Q9219_000893 [cf. Caloplaca sp. 3 TL-2023]
MDGWGEVQRLQLPLSERQGLPPAPTGIGTILFDTQQDLLWIGTDSGRVLSYYGSDLQRYTSLQAHPAQDGAVKQFLFHDRGILSLGSRSVHLLSRRGLTQWHISEPSMTDLQCMSFLGKDAPEVLVAGCQGVMYRIDIDRGVIVKEVSARHEYMLMRNCRYICAATNSGAVDFLDTDTLDVVKSWQAYSSKVSDMDARNNYLVTCGWSSRPYGGAILESFAKVYDLRKLEQLPPIPFHGGPAYVQLHPKLSTTSILSSATGQVQVVDLMNPNASNLQQVVLGNYMSHLVLAPSGAAWAVADNDGVVQIWGLSRSKLRFTESAAPVEFADEDFPPPAMGVDAELPFNTVGMPHYREKLLSIWSEDPVYEIGFLPPRIDPDILKHMTPASLGFRAHNPKKTLRNQRDRMSIIDSNGVALAAPKFLSEKDHEANSETEKERRISDAELLTNQSLAGNIKADVPVMYRLMEIKYSRYGVDDFDFGYVIRSLGEASKLQLTEETSPQNTLEVRIQEANRFLLKQIGMDYQRIAPSDGKLDQTFVSHAFTNMRCTSCYHETLRPNPKNFVALSYHALNINPRMRGAMPSFSRVLKDSFEHEYNQRMWCDRCRRYQLVQSWETVQNVPPVLMINTGLTKQNEVAISSRESQNEPHWHLFNDFLVRKVDKEEALRFATTWKTPTILAYQYQGASNAIDDSWKTSLDTSCLFMNWSLKYETLVVGTSLTDNINSPYNVLQHNWPCVLDPATEPPRTGTHVPIDTEFVRLQQEEIEILATGDRQVIRPTREGLARVSVLRANGPHEGLPFIDDYISISEPVVDYVTKYSGVSAGDLDPAVSVHPLVPLKVAYKKLWLLLNLGCIFVGHGLIKDFRNIDIFVPKPQIVDTVTLFYNPARSKRNLSLRFLAWYLLKENIQSEAHDSIEDALTALKLWRKYQEFQDAGIVEKMIDEIYTAGRKLNYKVPDKGSEKWFGLAVPSRGRETPDIDSGVSGPSTPVNKKTGGSEYFESPLK